MTKFIFDGEDDVTFARKINCFSLVDIVLSRRSIVSIVGTLETKINYFYRQESTKNVNKIKCFKTLRMFNKVKCFKTYLVEVTLL